MQYVNISMNFMVSFKVICKLFSAGSGYRAHGAINQSFSMLDWFSFVTRFTLSWDSFSTRLVSLIGRPRQTFEINIFCSVKFSEVVSQF